MQAPFGLPAVFAERSERERLAFGTAIAVAVHALLLLSAVGRPERALELVRSLQDEALVQVEVPEPAGSPDRGDTAPGEAAAAALAPPPVKLREARVRSVRSVHPAVVAAPETGPFEPISAGTAALESPGTTAPIPSNSRANQRLQRSGGAGTGSGGLFGNGRFAGDGPGALKAKICFIPETTRSLRQIQDCPVVYEQFLDEINIPLRRFEDGFPGFEDRTEYFAADITGSFSVTQPGTYLFRLKSDDGSQLFIDNQLLVDNDGVHDAISKRAQVELREGRHRIRVRYFQAMKYNLALQLFVTPPGAAERLFSSAL